MKLPEAGDRTQAEALRIAEDHLRRLGWKFTPADVGRRAREIIEALTAFPGKGEGE
ncbi:hypothetical protein T8J41_13670 [Nitratireductor rhodophyticola]|uniref:hypothetical protein n=1 Tax=Nitratireductor rhodophyticola TaxID=2854036 RepID=UPI002AC9D697|nr:hypothetical protein [Nitratireductor rhodophyticola]WPZ13204.1 hypothetical protein T8J41_13670 [Nitratireductor rhodophyticola]